MGIPQLLGRVDRPRGLFPGRVTALVWTVLRLMPSNKYGLFAWFVMLWTAVASLAPLRRLSSRFFLLHHNVVAVAMLALLWIHGPSHHRFTVNLAALAYCDDVASRLAYLIYANARGFGYSAVATVEDDEVVLLRIDRVGFHWTPGQHIYIWSPRFPFFFMRPFTIANCCAPDQDSSQSPLQLVIRVKTGFTSCLGRTRVHRTEDR